MLDNIIVCKTTNKEGTKERFLQNSGDQFTNPQVLFYIALAQASQISASASISQTFPTPPRKFVTHLTLKDHTGPMAISHENENSEMGQTSISVIHFSSAARKILSCCKDKWGRLRNKMVLAMPDQDRTLSSLFHRRRKDGKPAKTAVLRKRRHLPLGSRECNDETTQGIAKVTPLQLSPDVMSNLKDSLLKMRQAEKDEARLITRLHVLDGNIHQLDRSMFELDDLDPGELPGIELGGEEVSKTRRRVEAVRAAKLKLEQRREHLDNELARVCDSMAEEQAEIRTAMEGLFVSNGLLPRCPQIHAVEPTNAEAPIIVHSKAHQPTSIRSHIKSAELEDRNTRESPYFNVVLDQMT